MHVLRDGGPYREELREIEQFLETRALLFQAYYMLSRVIWSILGVAWWQKAFRDRHEN